MRQETEAQRSYKVPLFPEGFHWQRAIQERLDHAREAGSVISRTDAIGEVFRVAGRARLLDAEKVVFRGTTRDDSQAFLNTAWEGVAAIAFGSIVPYLDRVPFDGYFDVVAAQRLYESAIQNTSAPHWEIPQSVTHESFSVEELIAYENTIIQDPTLVSLLYDGELCPSSVRTFFTKSTIQHKFTEVVLPYYRDHIAPALKQLSIDTFPKRLKDRNRSQKVIEKEDAET